MNDNKTTIHMVPEPSTRANPSTPTWKWISWWRRLLATWLWNARLCRRSLNGSTIKPSAICVERDGLWRYWSILEPVPVPRSNVFIMTTTPSRCFKKKGYVTKKALRFQKPMQRVSVEEKEIVFESWMQWNAFLWVKRVFVERLNICNIWW